MSTFRKTKMGTLKVEHCVKSCDGNNLDGTVKELNADGWNIRQIYHEPPSYYRVFAQRELAAELEE